MTTSRHAERLLRWRGPATRLVRLVTRLEVAVAGVMALLIFLLVLVQAVQRYLPVSGWAWTGELSRFSLVWLTFTVAGVLVTTDSHISLQLVDSVRNPLVTRVVRTFSCAVVAVVGAAFAVEALTLVHDEMVLRSPAMEMPMGWLYVLPFLGFLSASVRAAVMAMVFAVRGVPRGSSAQRVAGLDGERGGAA